MRNIARLFDYARECGFRRATFFVTDNSDFDDVRTVVVPPMHRLTFSWVRDGVLNALPTSAAFQVAPPAAPACGWEQTTVCKSGWLLKRTKMGSRRSSRSLRANRDGATAGRWKRHWVALLWDGWSLWLVWGPARLDLDSKGVKPHKSTTMRGETCVSVHELVRGLQRVLTSSDGNDFVAVSRSSSVSTAAAAAVSGDLVQRIERAAKAAAENNFVAVDPLVLHLHMATKGSTARQMAEKQQQHREFFFRCADLQDLMEWQMAFERTIDWAFGGDDAQALGKTAKRRSRRK